MSARSSSSVACSAAVRTIRPCSAGFTRSRIAAQPLAHVVGKPLGDAVRLGVRDQHHEPSRQRHLLGEAGALGADRVLRDLADDELTGAEDVLDAAVVGLLLDVLGVVLDVAAVQHGVLRRGDVDERRLHAGQHVLDPPDVDVAVDEADVVGRAADVVLDQVAALEHADLGHARPHLDAHEEAPDRLAVALAAAPLLERDRCRARTSPAWSGRRDAASSAARLRTALGLGDGLLGRALPAPRRAPVRRARAGCGRRRRRASGRRAEPGGCRRSAACGPSALSAASTDIARPSRIGSGSSSGWTPTVASDRRLRRCRRRHVVARRRLAASAVVAVVVVGSSSPSSFPPSVPPEAPGPVPLRRR